MTSTDTNFPFIYKLYGLAIWSQVDLPELMPVTDPSLLDGLNRVEIRIGEVPEQLENGRIVETWFQFKKGICLYNFDEGGRYLIENGTSITIQRKDGVKEIDMRAYLFGSVFGTLIHQHRLLPLHISAVYSPSGVIAFTGDSGAGKSTIASVMHERTGWPVVCDDVAVLRPDETIPMLHSGILRMKLLENTVHLINKNTEDMNTHGEDEFQKYHLIEPGMFVLKSVPLHALIELNKGDECQLNLLGGARSFECVTNAIYRPYLIMMFGDRDQTIRKCAQIANSIQTFDLQRPWSVEGIEQSVELLKAQFDK